MKLMVCGSRSITNKEWVWQQIEKTVKLFNGRPVEILEGDASGVDKLAGEWAKSHNIPLKLYPANWSDNGRAASHIRNRQMVDDCDISLILWDGTSMGTYEDLCYADKNKKPYFLHVYNEDQIFSAKIELAASKNKGKLKAGTSGLSKLHSNANI